MVDAFLNNVHNLQNWAKLQTSAVEFNCPAFADIALSRLMTTLNFHFAISDSSAPIYARHRRVVPFDSSGAVPFMPSGAIPFEV